MSDSQIIGLRHSVSKEVLLGSILGRLRTIFGLLVYRNAAGHRWLLNTILNDGDSGGFEREDTAFEQDCVKLEFVPKREISKEDRAVLAACGYVPAKKGGHPWPQFRSLTPGGYPWHQTEAEAKTLLFALPRVAAVARLTREQPHIWDNHCDGEMAFVPDDFDPAVGPLRANQLEWVPMIPPPEPQPERVSFDEATLARLRKLTTAQGFFLELDVAYAPFPIAHEGRPCFPKLAMAVDGASGFISGVQLGDPSDSEGASALGTVLRDSLTQFGHRPEVIGVQHRRVLAMLSEVADALGVAVRLEEELAQLNLARRSIEQRFSRGP